MLTHILSNSLIILSYHLHSAIFHAWKTYVRTRALSNNNSITTTETLRSRKGSILMSNDDVEEYDYSKTKMKTNTYSMKKLNSQSNSKMMSDCVLSGSNQHTNFNGTNNNDEEIKMDIDNNDNNDIKNNIKQTNDKKNYYNENKIGVEECSLGLPGLPGTFLSNEIMSKKILDIFQNNSSISKDKIRVSTHKQNKTSQSKTPKLSDFRILCAALIIDHNNNTEIKSKIMNKNTENEDEEMEDKLTHTTSTINGNEKNDRASTTHQHQHQLQLQLRLQHALDDLNMSDVAAAVALGATVEHTHIRQSALHFGDEYVPMFCLLLSYGELYIADR